MLLVGHCDAHPVNEGIPTGSYCYGYVPKPESGFLDMAEVDAYLNTLPLDKQLEEWPRIHQQVDCPHWQTIDHGRVRCGLLGLVAVLINEHSERLAAAFYREHPEAEEQDQGFLIGDGVKECNINRDGIDFSFPSDPRNQPNARNG